jgi:cytochrome c
MKYILRLLVLFLIFSSCKKKSVSILVFSKTEGYRHESIPDGIAAIQKMAQEENWKVDATEDASVFTDKNLEQYGAVIFLSTTGNVLDAEQEKSFKRYIQAGGGFVGIHAATDTEYEWEWYNNLVGAYFLSHPKTQKASMKVVDRNHLSCKHLGADWTKTDEWYNFKDFNKDVKVLLDLDETSYEGGTHNGPHPIAWYHDYDGGKSFYTGLGHTPESFLNPKFILHVKGGIKYAIGKNVRKYPEA